MGMMAGIKMLFLASGKEKGAWAMEIVVLGGLQWDEEFLHRDVGAVGHKRYRVGGEFGLVREHVRHDPCRAKVGRCRSCCLWLGALGSLEIYDELGVKFPGEFLITIFVLALTLKFERLLEIILESSGIKVEVC
jgi:hypothetical protein